MTIVSKLHKNSQKISFENKNLFVMTQFYPPDFAPTGQLIQELVSYLASQGHSIKVFTGQPGYVYQESNAPPIEYQDQLYIRRTRAVKFCPRRIRGKLVNGLLFFLRAAIHGLKNLKKREDIILLTSAPAFLPILGYIFNLFKGVSYVCLIYDLYPDVAVELKVFNRKNWMVKLWDHINGLVWGKAHQVIVLSNSMKDRVLIKHPELADKISVIHNWCDPEKILPIQKSDNWFAKEHKLTNKFTVLYSGNMGRCHDMDTILYAAYLLKNEDIKFVFIGGGAEYEKCRQQIKHWNMERNCLFLPYQDRETISYSLTASDLCLVSIKEGLEGVVAPSKFYTMLATGRPIAAICEPHSYLRGIIADAKCGESFTNDDSYGLAQFIRHLAFNPQLAKTMGEAGRSYLSSNFTLEIIAQQYSQALGLKNTAAKPEKTYVNNVVNMSSKNFHRKLLGEILQEIGLLNALQIDEILKEQKLNYPNLRFGEIVVNKGWLKQETIDFVLNYALVASQALGEAKTLLTIELNEIVNDCLEHYPNLLVGELAIKKGWINQETMNFVLTTISQE